MHAAEIIAIATLLGMAPILTDAGPIGDIGRRQDGALLQALYCSAAERANTLTTGTD